MTTHNVNYFSKNIAFKKRIVIEKYFVNGQHQNPFYFFFYFFLSIPISKMTISETVTHNRRKKSFEFIYTSFIRNTYNTVRGTKIISVIWKGRRKSRKNMSIITWFRYRWQESIFHKNSVDKKYWENVLTKSIEKDI